jgi:hypothetical protein
MKAISRFISEFLNFEHTYMFEISVAGHVEIISRSGRGMNEAVEAVFATLRDKYSNAAFTVISWKKYR